MERRGLCRRAAVCRQPPAWRRVMEQHALLRTPRSRRAALRRAAAAILGVLLLLLLCCVPTAAEDTASQVDMQAYYNSQLEASGAGQLPGKLPEETRGALSGLGVAGDDFQTIGELTPQKFFQTVFGIAGTEGKGPLKAAAASIAVMLLCALISAMKMTFGERPLGGVVSVVGTLCVSVVIVEPIVQVLVRATAVIQAACGFSVASVPVMAGILAAMGRPASAASMQLLLTTAGNVLQVLSAHVFTPVMQVLLAMSVVSAVSPDVNLGGILKFVTKAIKWLLGLSMTLFTGLLTMRSLVNAGADTLAGRAARFVVSSFVPVVGHALSDAMRTVGGCVEMLRGGVGAFGLLALVVLFLPSLLGCLLWMLTLHACAAIGEIFSLSEMAHLLHACAQVLETLLAILLCSMTVLIVSGVVLMMMGGGTA